MTDVQTELRYRASFKTDLNEEWYNVEGDLELVKSEVLRVMSDLQTTDYQEAYAESRGDVLFTDLEWSVIADLEEGASVTIRYGDRIQVSPLRPQ
jgi:hypothetical protein